MNQNLITRYLSKRNKLEYDEDISFIEEDHVYNVRSEYFPDLILSKYNGGSSLPFNSVTTFISKYFPSTFDELALKIWNNLENRVRMESDITYKYYGCKSFADIKKIWNRGAELGTKMHGHFEDLANLFAYLKDHPGDSAYENYVVTEMSKYDEFRYFKHFCEVFGLNNNKRDFFRTELSMFHPELHVSGMIDGLVYNREKNGFEIIDYKRSKGGVKPPPKNPRKDVKDLSASSRGQILPSIMMLRNIPIVKYGLQLSLYRYMLGRLYPNYKIIGLYLISIDSELIEMDVKHNSFNAFEIIQIPLEQYNQPVLEIFQQRAKDILDECGDKLPNNLFEHLFEFLPPQPSDPEDEDSDNHESYESSNKKSKLN